MKRLLTTLAAPLLLVAASAAAETQEVYVYNWSEYMPESVLEQFTAETGIQVRYTTYDSNEAMYAKVKVLDGKGYDIVVPSTYYISKMRREGLLAPIDHTKLPHYTNLDPKLLDKPYDPGNQYSIPYLWGTTGIGVDARVVDPSTVTAWADLWRPELAGKLLLTNDMREVFHIGLRLKGFSGNSSKPEEIEAAYQALTELVPGVKVFNSDSPKMPYLAREVAAGMIWNGEAYQAQQEGADIRYIYPKEGVIIWADSLAIPKNAPNIDNAHRFIDFLLRPEIAKAISEEVGYATPNRAAVALLDEAVRNDRTVYPQEADLANGEFQLDVGEAITIYEKYWEKLKAGR